LVGFASAIAFPLFSPLALPCEDFLDMPASSPQSLAARKALFAVLLLAIVAAIVCAVLDNPPWNVPESAKQMKNPVAPSDAVLAEIRPIYLDKCAVCHGDSGKGDGHDASLYDPRPSNFTDAQHINAVSDGELFYKISQGRKPMPSFRKRLSEQQRWHLVLMIRSFATPATSPATDNRF
jgi:mono/diheme cytochrome c family protein